MNKICLRMFVIVVFLVTGCSTIPTDDIETKTEVAPKANFKDYKTYAWLGAAAILNDPEGKWEPPQFDADAEITLIVDRELRSRGMTETATNPDIYAAYALGVNMDALKIKTDPQSRISVLENVPQGALLIVLIDGKSGFVVWAGAATAEIKNLGSDVARQRLNYAITDMFKKLPR